MSDFEILLLIYGVAGTVCWVIAVSLTEDRRTYLQRMWLTPVWPLVLLWWFVRKLYRLWVEAWGKVAE